MDNKLNRNVYVITSICYIDEKSKIHIFSGKTNGTIARSIKGNHGF